MCKLIPLSSFSYFTEYCGHHWSDNGLAAKKPRDFYELVMFRLIYAYICLNASANSISRRYISLCKESFQYATVGLGMCHLQATASTTLGATGSATGVPPHI